MVSKYNSTGKRSKAELEYAKWLSSKGKTFEEQPKYILQDSFEFQGKKYKAITFTPDFKIGNILVDFKGTVDNVYPIKKKLFIKKYSLPLIEVCKCPIYLSALMCKIIKKCDWDCLYYTLDLKKFIKSVRINKDTSEVLCVSILKDKIIYNHDIEAWDLRR